MERKAEKSVRERQDLRLELPLLALQVERGRKQKSEGSSQKLGRAENRFFSRASRKECSPGATPIFPQ